MDEIPLGDEQTPEPLVEVVACSVKLQCVECDEEFHALSWWQTNQAICPKCGAKYSVAVLVTRIEE